MALEPSYVHRLEAQRGLSHRLRLGVRGTYETANLDGAFQDLTTGQAIQGEGDKKTADLGALAVYAEETISVLHGSLELGAGLRTEAVGFAVKDLRLNLTGSKRNIAVLPAASVAWFPAPLLAVFASYGRSFGPVQFLQMSLAASDADLRPEFAQSLEAGARMTRGEARLGVELWLKQFKDLQDISLDDIKQPGDSRAIGVDAESAWSFRDLLSTLPDLTLRVGYSGVRGQIVKGEFIGKTLPWFPRSEAWTSVEYRNPVGFSAGTDVRYIGRYYTDYSNSRRSDETGKTGIVPDVTLWNAFVAMSVRPSRSSDLTLSLGCRNITNELWITRADDRNGGILPQQPRMFWINFTVRTNLTGTTSVQRRPQSERPADSSLRRGPVGLRSAGALGPARPGVSPGRPHLKLSNSDQMPSRFDDGCKL